MSAWRNPSQNLPPKGTWLISQKVVPAWLGSGRVPAATALAYKYLNGSSAFRRSTPVAKIKLSDLLSIYLVKYDSPGLVFSKMLSPFFFS